jgi:hypothetical protein
VRGGGAAPAGVRLGTWAAAAAVRQLLVGVRGPVRRAPRADWWVVGRAGRFVAPTADGEAVFLFTTDRRALLGGLIESFLLHLRLVVRWRRTAARYRAAADALVAPAAWRKRFEG